MGARKALAPHIKGERPVSAWHWLKEQLRERLGEREAEALWAEYRARARLDLEAAQLREQQRRARDGNARARRWLEERGYSPDDPATP